MPITSETLWDAVGRIGKSDPTADKIDPAVIAKLIQLRIIQLNATGLPELTGYGYWCFDTMESGDGEVPELDNYGRASTEG
jgi:hypothetical protein